MPYTTDMLLNQSNEKLEMPSILHLFDPSKNKAYLHAKFRDDTILSVLSVLSSQYIPHVILAGPAGSGKTKIVEELSYLLSTSSPLIPQRLKNGMICSLSCNDLYTYTTEGKLDFAMRAIFSYIQAEKRPVILFIDDIHLLMNKNLEKALHLLKPYLSSPSVRILGTSSTQELNILRSDPTFYRRFSKIFVSEPDNEQTYEILKDMAPGFIDYYGNIELSSSILKMIPYIASQYSEANAHRPGNAIQLLDRTISYALIKQPTASDQPLRIQEDQVRETALRTLNSKTKPLSKASLEQAFSSILGQEPVIQNIIQELLHHQNGLFEQKTPLSFMFAGPTGTGKTETAKIISSCISGTPPIILNMTEFNNSSTINRILGSPVGYIGSESNQEYPFDILESNPRSVILLDEFEKCDKSVQRLFMSALDEGYLKTNTGKTIDFSNSIIIATTNAGNFSDGFKSFYPKTNQDISAESQIKALSSAFDKELLNRFPHRYVFNALDPDTYTSILREKYEREVLRINKEKGIQLPATIPEDQLNRISTETYVKELGARPALTAVKQYIYSIFDTLQPPHDSFTVPV